VYYTSAKDKRPSASIITDLCILCKKEKTVGEYYLQKKKGPIGRTEAKDMRVHGHALAHLFALPEILHVRNSETLVS
jgi:hypothetical protein